MVSYMKNLIKFHFFYLFNKQTIIILIIALLLCSISFYGNIVSSKFLLVEEEINIYFSTSVAISKIIISFIVIFLYTTSMTKDNDFYIYYLTNTNRKNYILTKLLTLHIINFVIFSTIFLLFLLIGFIANKYFYFQITFIENFINIYLISIINGLYGMLLMQTFNNIFVIYIPFLFVIISENINESIFSLIIPSDYFGVIYLIWLSIILHCINYQLYINRDLNY